MSLNWSEINTYNGSQNNAFEELVCQLAAEEYAKKGNDFNRVAAPDGGVEAYCIFPNGEEYGWQAKYFTSMGTSQWKQLTESIETTIKTHPKLTKYFICIPLDREDPRMPGKKWFMDKWLEKVLTWKKLANEKEREIDFEFWGSHELILRLSQEKNSGRKLFWFAREDFSDDWFACQVRRSISDLNERFSPNLDVELSMERSFDAISRNRKFDIHLNVVFDEFSNILKEIRSLSIPINFEKISAAMSQIKKSIQVTLTSKLRVFDVENMVENLNEIQICIESLDEYIQKNETEKREYKKLKNASNYLWDALNSFSNFVQSDFLKLANTRIGVVSGEAGIGKSHMLASICSKRLEDHKSCVLLLGQHFVSNESPWTQILRNLLRINCNDREFLGALNAKAEAQGERLLICIDAINEGRGKYFWPEHIKGFIKDISAYPWLCLIISVRSSYEKLMIPESLILEKMIVKIHHQGFDGVENHAVRIFFSRYGIEPPSAPLFNSEFRNPLFLKLFCEGLYRSNLTKIPKGYGGISSVIKYFLECINMKLSAPIHFDYPSSIKLVNQTVNEVIEARLRSLNDLVPYDVAYSIAEEKISKFSKNKHFLEALISEGVFSKNLIPSQKISTDEYVYFAYERFEDHLIAAHLLDTYFAQNSMEKSFRNFGELHKYVEDEWQYQGLLESLSCQLPERVGMEFYEILDIEYRGRPNIVEAFLHSLNWREHQTSGEMTEVYINQYVLANADYRSSLFQTIINNCAEPENFYNANWLHQYLMTFTMADRDALWTSFIHEQDADGCAVYNLISWVESREDMRSISIESRLLIAKTLTWIFTSTNIFLRDRATKALVIVLEDRLSISLQLLKEFSDVNDPYVVERMYAAIYGAVLRSRDYSSFEDLTEYIYLSVFDKSEVYPNVLVRDYARNIIEYALHRGSARIGNEELIRPPYKSTFPSKFPTNDEVKLYEYDYSAEGFKRHYSSQNSILSSMVTEYGRGIGAYGDFGRYTFQSALHDWNELDPNDLSNWACKLIFDKFGYAVEKHGYFDLYAGSGDRHKNKKERIGKKYQWIALYEILARVADNYQMEDETNKWGEKKQVWFQGPWSSSLRNIDPTMINNDPPSATISINAASENLYGDWSGTNQDWLKNSKCLPCPKALLTFMDNDDSEWIFLERDPIWHEPLGLGQERYVDPKKCLHFQISGYFVKCDEEQQLLKLIRKSGKHGLELPGQKSNYQIFSHEYYWSPAYSYHSIPYYSGLEWERVYGNGHTEIANVYVSRACEQYNWESGEENVSKISYLGPRREMFVDMGLHHSDKVGAWLDKNAELVCFDSSINNSNRRELAVRKKLLEAYLEKNGLSLFWVCSGQKNISTSSLSRYENFDPMELFGVLNYKDGQIDGAILEI